MELPMRVLGTFAIVVAVAAALATGGAVAGSPPTTPSVLFGVAADERGDAAASLDRVAASVGKMPALFGSYVSFASPNFDRRLADGIRSRGAMPLITWEPWGDGALGPEQPAYRLARFVNGDFDSFIRH